MNGTLVVALNLTRITHCSYFKVPLSMVELFVKVLNKMLLSRQKVCTWFVTMAPQNNYTTNLIRLIVGAPNSLKLLALLAKLFLLVS